MLKLLTALVAMVATWNVAHAGTSTTTSQNLSGTTGVVTAQAGSNTIYTNVAQNNTVTVNVPENASVQLTNPTYATDTQTGLHNLQTINVQGNSSDYTVWSYYGQVTLTNKATGQVISFQLTTPTSGSNNSGVTVNFSDGSLAFTSNVSPTGVWTTWVTEGGSGTSNWGNNSVMLPYTAATAMPLGDVAGSLDTAVTSQDVNWGGSSTSGDADAGADSGSGAASAAAAAAGAAAGADRVPVPVPTPGPY